MSRKIVLKRLLPPDSYSGILVGNAGVGEPIRVSVTLIAKTSEVKLADGLASDLEALNGRVCMFNASDAQNLGSGFKIVNSRVLLVRLRYSRYYLKSLLGTDPSM